MSDREDESRDGSGRNGGGGGRGGEGKNHNKYRKDKPWDSASIDHWSIPDWKDDNMKVLSAGGGVGPVVCAGVASLAMLILPSFGRIIM